MEYLGGNPNGLNQQTKDKISLFVSGSRIANFSSQSVDVVGNFSASKIQTDEIDSFGNNPLQINTNTQISGSITASLFQGDGSGLTNISAASIGDIDRLKSGSAIAQISPNKGLTVNTGVSVDSFLIVSGSATFKNDLYVDGKILATTIQTTLISSSIIFSLWSVRPTRATLYP
jgi:hypothetical protein